MPDAALPQRTVRSLVAFCRTTIWLNLSKWQISRFAVLWIFVLELSILADRRELRIYKKEGVKYFYKRGFMFLLNTLNAELNPIYLLLALLEAHHILHVSSVRVNYMACKGHA